MNIPLQIGLGLLPGTLFILILIIRRRAFSFGRILFTAGTAVICGTFLTFGVRTALSDAGIFEKRLTREQLLRFAGALVTEGATDAAEEVLDEFEALYGYDDACLLLKARMALLDGDPEAARALYGYLKDYCDLGDTLDDELALLDTVTDPSGSSAGDPIAAYLTRIGEDPASYGYSAIPASASSAAAEPESDGQDIFSSLKKKIRKEMGITDEDRDAAKTVAALSEPTAKIIAEKTGEAVQEDDAKGVSLNRYRRMIRKIEEEYPEYLSLSCMKKARIKAYILAGDYKALAALIDQNSSYHEAMIASELYMGGFVKSSDFDENFKAMDKEQANALSDRLYGIYDKESHDLNKQEKKRLKSRVQALEQQLKDPALCAVKELLIDAAQGEAGDDQTKVCLALAKIENHSGNETSTDEYLGQAIYSSQSSPDDSYVSAMNGIITVINSDDTESIKHVSEYVDAVLDHSLTVDVESIISADASENRQKADKIQSSDSAQDKKEQQPDFSRTTVDYVSRVRSAISIGRIDPSSFDEVTARVQIDSSRVTDAAELKDLITVRDCGSEIRDFSLKKIDYTGTNIMLLCDVSGSMDVAISDLRTAVLTFIGDQNDKEQLSIVTFSNTIDQSRPFGSSDAELTALAEGMYPSGGTDMYNATLSSLPGFPAGNDKANNVLVLMTDGQDNDPRSDAQIRSEIGALAQKYNATIYTLGLGIDVDTAYLTAIADCTGGEFIYVSDSSSLSAFYDRLHAQMNAQYQLTYKALDTMTMTGRTLEVELPDENVRDLKTYSLVSDDEITDDTENAGTAPEAYTDLTVSGLSPRAVYKGKQDIPVTVSGTGFKQEDKFTVKFKGNIDYSLQGEFKDESNFKITVPSGMAAGTYDVEIVVGDKKRYFPAGFSVVSDKAQKKTVFGPYVFTSQEKIQNSDGSTLLRGMVTLNGWLHFKGDLQFSGDPDTDAQLVVTDRYGSYVEYDPSTAKGVARYFADKGIALDVPVLNTFRLYNDPAHRYDYENYLVDDISTAFFDILRTVRLQRVTLRLYPNSFGIYYKAGTTNLPYQDKVLKFVKNTEMFTLDTEESAVLTDKQIGLILHVNMKNKAHSKPNSDVRLLNLTTKFNGGFEIKLNTLKEEFKLGLSIKFPVFVPKEKKEEEGGFGAEIEWKGHLYPDAVRVKIDIPGGIDLPTTVPISLDDFSVGVSDIGTAVEKGEFGRLVFEGTFSLSSLKVKDKFPALEPFFGDMSLLEMPDTKVTVRFVPFTLTADATLKLLSEITLANASVKIGTIDDYSDQLLSIHSEQVKGLIASLKVGLMWHSSNDDIKIDLYGSGKLSVHSRFMGVSYGGGFSYDINWWFINIENNKSGELALGFYRTHRDKTEFVIVYETENWRGKNVKKAYYIDENGHCGKSNGSLE